MLVYEGPLVPNVDSLAARVVTYPRFAPYSVLDAYQVDAEIFSAYECKSIPRLGNVHPGDISEPGLLAAVSLPSLTYGSEAFEGEVIDDTKLSRLQLEGVSGVQTMS